MRYGTTVFVMRRDGLFTTSLANAFCLRLHARKTWISARQVWQEAARDGFAASIGAERNRSDALSFRIEAPGFCDRFHDSTDGANVQTFQQRSVPANCWLT